MELTPKQKAKKLIKQFLPYVDWNDLQEDCTNRKWALRNAKQCALLTVEEIISIKLLWFQKDTEYLDFWKEVKEELLKM